MRPKRPSTSLRAAPSLSPVCFFGCLPRSLTDIIPVIRDRVEILSFETPVSHNVSTSGSFSIGASIRFPRGEIVARLPRTDASISRNVHNGRERGDTTGGFPPRHCVIWNYTSGIMAVSFRVPRKLLTRAKTAPDSRRVVRPSSPNFLTYQ